MTVRACVRGAASIFFCMQQESLVDSAKAIVGLRHLFRPMVPDFLHGAPQTGACAAFIKESRMKFVNARELDRKFGCTLGRTWGTRPGKRTSFFAPSTATP